MFAENVRWYQPPHQPEPGRNQDQIIEITDDGNKIRDQIYRADGVSDDHGSENFRGPRCTRIAECRCDHNHLGLQSPGPGAYVFEHSLCARFAHDQFAARRRSGRRGCLVVFLTRDSLQLFGLIIEQVVNVGASIEKLVGNRERRHQDQPLVTDEAVFASQIVELSLQIISKLFQTINVALAALKTVGSFVE